MQISNYFNHCTINVNPLGVKESDGMLQNQKSLFDADNQYTDMDRYWWIRFPYETKIMVSLQREIKKCARKEIEGLEYCLASSGPVSSFCTH